MSQSPPPGPRVELTTTHVGGGGSAKLVALAAVVILGAVVYVGMSGRSPAPATPQRTAAPVAAATAEPTPSTPTTPSDSPESFPPPGTPGPTPAPTPARWAPDRVLYAIDTSGFSFLSVRNILITSESGNLEGALGITGSPNGRVKIAMSQMTITEQGNAFRVIGKWTINARKVAVDEPPIALLDVVVEGRPKELGAAPIVQSGYRFTVMGLRSRRSLTLFFYVVPSPLVRPIGDDGLIGWPAATDAPATR